MNTPREVQQSNADVNTVRHFGDEWAAFTGDARPKADMEAEFNVFFNSFPWQALPQDAEGFDAGCGTGRWAAFVAPRVKRLNCIDPAAKALAVAQRKLQSDTNVRFFNTSINDMPLTNASQDFGYCLGVLHHIPDTEKALQTCVDKLKPGAPFLLYLYPKLDYRPLWWRCLDQLANGLRHLICRLPHPVKIRVTDALACLVYWPVSRLSLLLEKLGISINIPLSSFKHRSFYDLRTNALDTFGTPLEKRFSQAEITQMMASSGLDRISFGSGIKWVAVGYKKDR